MTKQKIFTSARALDALIMQYIEHIKGEYKVVQKRTKGTDGKTKITKEKICVHEPEPATLTGLALRLQ